MGQGYMRTAVVCECDNSLLKRQEKERAQLVLGYQHSQKLSFETDSLNQYDQFTNNFDNSNPQIVARLSNFDEFVQSFGLCLLLLISFPASDNHGK